MKPTVAKSSLAALLSATTLAVFAQGKDLAAEPEMQCHGTLRSAMNVMKGLRDNDGFPIRTDVLLRVAGLGMTYDERIKTKYIERMKVSAETVKSATQRIRDMETDRAIKVAEETGGSKEDVSRALETHYQSRLLALSCK